MPRKNPPAQGACEALCNSYGEIGPCPRKARWIIADGLKDRHLCGTHAKLLVWQQFVESGKAVEMPQLPPAVGKIHFQTEDQ